MIRVSSPKPVRESSHLNFGVARTAGTMAAAKATMAMTHTTTSAAGGRTNELISMITETPTSFGTAEGRCTSKRFDRSARARAAAQQSCEQDDEQAGSVELGLVGCDRQKQHNPI